MPTPIDLDRARDSVLLSEAMYVYNLPVWNTGEDPAAYARRFEAALVDKTGDNEDNKLTTTQALDIASRFRLIRKAESPAFTGGVFETERGEYFLAMRGTETGQSYMDDKQLVVRGTAMDAVKLMARFWNEDCKDLHGQKLVVTGHSLSGALSSDFARLYPANVEQVVTFNSAGVSDLRGPMGASHDWWKSLTDQNPDWSWGAGKTLAFYSDTARKLVHQNFGAMYMQVGQQSALAYGEKLSPGMLEQHSIISMSDTLAFDKAVADLGIGRENGEAYVKFLSKATPHGIYAATYNLAKSVGLKDMPMVTDRESFFRTLVAIEMRAPAVSGKLLLLGEMSADELAREAVGTSQRSEAIRQALASGSDVALLEGPSKSDSAGYDYWKDRATQMLAAQEAPTSPGSFATPVAAATPERDSDAIAAVRAGLGGDALRYSDDELSTRITTPVLDDIKHNGFPSQEVADLRAMLVQLATSEGLPADKYRS